MHIYFKKVADLQVNLLKVCQANMLTLSFSTAAYEITHENY